MMDDIKQYLKDNLTINVEDCYGGEFEISIDLEGEEIDKTSFFVKESD
jgi:hypothetical protein